MITQLVAARDLLRSALDQYLNVCLAIDELYAVNFSSQTTLSELTDDISNELSLVPSYEETLLKAKAVLGSARNRSTRVAPISRLPTDVLVRIFQLATAEGNCTACDQKGTNKYLFPEYPSLLTRICSRWRQVAMTCTYLWSHIDIPSPVSHDDATITRMQEYIARSGTSLLEVHIVELEKPEVLAPIALGSLARVLAPLSARIRSLDLNLSASPTLPFGPLTSSGVVGYSMMLSACFSNCRIGTLERLATHSRDPHTPSAFIAAAFSDPRKRVDFFGESRETVVSLSVPETTLEDLWLPVTVLELKGFYPRWTSNAYRGLVELRLRATGNSPISQAELVTILSSSPRLQTLDFNIRITQTSPHDQEINPSNLEELKTLVTGERTPKQLSQFLRLIAPGSHPLSISLSCPSAGHSGPMDAEVQKFFARSNVGIIGVAGSYGYPQLIELMALVPDARILVLSQMSFRGVDWGTYKLTSTDSHLRDLYVLKWSIIAQDDLFRLIEANHIKKLIAGEDCDILDVSKLTTILDTRTLYEQASRLGVSFRLVASGELNPVQEWGWSL